MHILITGGTGLIGSALCKALLAEGHRLTVLTRSKGQTERGFGSSPNSRNVRTPWTQSSIWLVQALRIVDGLPLINGRLGRVVWILPMILSRGCLGKKHRRSA